jgi:hypothetical protein
MMGSKMEVRGRREGGEREVRGRCEEGVWEICVE